MLHLQINFLPLYPKLTSNPKLNSTISSRNLHLRRSSSSSSSNGRDPSLSNEAMSGLVDELLKREENRPLLDGLNEASGRVERAREALAEIERQEAEALQAKEQVSLLEKRRLEIAESQKELLEARAMVDEAQHSLSSNLDVNNLEDASIEEINKDIERMESVKAASISAFTGMLASLPISLYHNTSYTQLIFNLVIIFVSCALFGVTFRYTVRRDLDNIQLKSGTSAAFGFVRGLAAVSVRKPLELDFDSFVSHSIDGTVCVSESVFIFLSASVALDFCFKTRILSPFPITKVEQAVDEES